MARLPKIEKPEEATRVSKKEFVDMIREKTGIKKSLYLLCMMLLKNALGSLCLRTRYGRFRRMGSFFLKPSTRREVRNMYAQKESLLLPPKYKPLSRIKVFSGRLIRKARRLTQMSGRYLSKSLRLLGLTVGRRD